MHGRRQMFALIRKCLDGFRKSQVTTICELTLGLVAGGRLGLAAIARGMPRTTTVRYHIKRLWRFAQNPRISVEAASDSLIRWLFGSAGGPRAVIGLDWTDLGDYWMLCASLLVRRRAVPLAWTIMTHGQFSADKKSRNDVEERLIQRLARALKGHDWVLVADRGFARADLFRKLSQWGILYVIRACGNVWVRAGRHDGILDNVARSPQRAVRWEHVAYHKSRRVPVSLVMTHEEPAPEPWYLVTNTPGVKPVVDLYRKRMWIEESFRDCKSQLGLDTLWLARPERMERMMILAALVILLAVLAACDHIRRFGDVDPQLTTKRKGRTISWFRQGIHLLRSLNLSPGSHTRRLSSLLELT